MYLVLITVDYEYLNFCVILCEVRDCIPSHQPLHTQFFQTIMTKIVERYVTKVKKILH